MSPLTDMFQRNKFEWSHLSLEVLTQLKATLLQAVILKLLDFTKHFIVEIDTSRTSIRVLLLQDGHSISYFNNKLQLHLFRQPIYNRVFLRE